MYKVPLDGEKSNPHLEVGKQYLVKYSGRWYIGTCGEQWFGHTFHIGSHSIQLGSNLITEIYLFTPPEDLKPGWYCQHV